MLKKRTLSIFVLLALEPVIWAAGSAPIVKSDLVFEEVDGFLTFEAEHYCKQENSDVRAWYLTTADKDPGVQPDGDPNHTAGASGGAYLEILPDTRRSHGDKLNATNFCPHPRDRAMGVLSYNIHVNNPGRYYVWARIQSTNSEDNGLHVGLDGEWPEHGQRMQWMAKNQWFWDCKQRTEKVHTGVPMEIWLDIEKPGRHTFMVSMREDGIEIDKFILAKDKSYRPKQNPGPAAKVKSGKLPKGFKPVAAPATPVVDAAPTGPAAKGGGKVMSATEFPSGSNGYYVDKKWLAIDPSKNKKAKTSKDFPFATGTYDVVFMAVGENDGKSKYRIAVNDEVIGTYSSPMTQSVSEEGPKYNAVFEGIKVSKGDKVSVEAAIGSADGSGHTRGRWAGLAFVTKGKGKALAKTVNAQVKNVPGFKRHPKIRKAGTTYTPTTDPKIRKDDGKGNVAMSGELKQWHKVTLTLDGPFAHELDAENPFMDYRMTVVFKHESGKYRHKVPGYFAADGNAAETSADSGTAWRAHLSPDVPGEWSYEVSLVRGKGIAVNNAAGEAVAPFNGKTGSFRIARTDKQGADLRGKGRLVYDGTRYLKLAGTGEVFYKCGADAPENLFAYADFDGPFKSDGQKDNLIKTWKPHVKDWTKGDPGWKNGMGKGLIGAINYLASEGMNSISFLPMNIGGDDRNVFPYTHYDERVRLDCSRLDQWEIVLAHGTAKGMFLHFKTMETENEMLLDNGNLGPERKLYYRELIARFSHHPALNWNLGEEINEATTAQKASWAKYLWETDPYHHPIVIHNMGNPHYDLLGPDFALTGFSLQTSSPEFKQVHGRTFDYVKRSTEAGKPWAVACDEPGDASHALLPDSDNPTHDNARKNALWGNFLAGGWGLEWYFGYKHDHSDLTCEDWRSRDKFWDQCKIALDFFNEHQLPVGDMWCMDELIDGKDDYVFADPGVVYLVFLKSGANTLDLSADKATFRLKWLNPRTGEYVQGGEVNGGGKVTLTPPDKKDWLGCLTK